MRFCHGGTGDLVTGGHEDDSRAASHRYDGCTPPVPRHAQGGVSASATGFAKTGMAILFPLSRLVKKLKPAFPAEVTALLSSPPRLAFHLPLPHTHSQSQR